MTYISRLKKDYKERVISELKKELEAYKREMKQNLEMIEQSLVERDALAKKYDFKKNNNFIFSINPK